MIINKKTRRLIYDSVYEVELKDIARYDTYPKTKVEFSQGFDDRLSNFISNKSNDTVKVLSKRKLLIVTVTTILLVALAVTVYAFRDSILNFFVNIYEDHTQLSSPEEPRDSIETYYTPTWLPDGYVSEVSSAGTTTQIKSWVNNGQRIKFTQMIESNNGIYFDDKNGEYTVLIIASNEVYYSAQNGFQVLRWICDGYSMKLECPDTIDLEIIELIIISIQGD